MAKPVNILGISCYYHDSAAVLLKDGEVVFAAQEERYTRKKHDDSLPLHAIQHALQYAGIAMGDVDAAVFYEKPVLKFFDRILPTYVRVWPRSFRSFHLAMQSWIRTKLWFPQNLAKATGYQGPVYFVPHHLSHAASAFYCSGFEEAAVLTVDGVGEWATTTIGHGNGTKLALLKEIHFPHSLGLLYSALTYYLGFKVNSAEYKVMGLAPFGTPKYLEQLRTLIHCKEDGSFALNMRYFRYEYGLTMTGSALERLLGQPRRKPESELTQFHKDIAASLQRLTEELLLSLARHAREYTGCKHLCLAGGVALNCVANGVLLRSGAWKDIFVQPAAGDAGGALGAALYLWHAWHDGKRTARMEHVFLGDEYDDASIRVCLEAAGIPYEELAPQDVATVGAALLSEDKVVGWFQGRMEYGPRSLGARSILANAQNPENWQRVNKKIKFRESFRPFAPAVLAERAKDYFAIDRESPYMLFVADVLPQRRTELPAVTHVDGSARLQTVRADQHPRFHALLREYEKKTGCPVVVNTSFNVRGEPIVQSPQDALHCFLRTDMDALMMGNLLVRKEHVPPERLPSRDAYLRTFQLD